MSMNVINESRESSPSLDTHERVRLLEDSLRFAGDAIGEETPDCAVDS